MRYAGIRGLSCSDLKSGISRGGTLVGVGVRVRVGGGRWGGGRGSGWRLEAGELPRRHLGAGRRVRPPLLGQHELIARDVRLDLFRDREGGRDRDRGEGEAQRLGSGLGLGLGLGFECPPRPCRSAPVRAADYPPAAGRSSARTPCAQPGGARGEHGIRRSGATDTSVAPGFKWRPGIPCGAGWSASPPRDSSRSAAAARQSRAAARRAPWGGRCCP